MNHGETDDTDIVSGDEGDLTPIHDIADPQSEEVVNPIEEDAPPYAVEQEPAASVSENQATEADWQAPIAEEPTIRVEASSEVSQPGGWQRIRNFFFGGSADVAARLNNLTQSIEDAPESPVNYVLRAELYMEMREYALAQSDFQRASELAETQFELADWGLLDQVMRDRALAGLEKVQRRLK